MSVAFINLIFINLLFNGIVASSNQQVIATTSGNIMMQTTPGSEFIRDVAGVMRAIDSAPGVVAASARTLVPAGMLYRGIQGSFQVIAIQPSQESRTTDISRKMFSGSFLSDSDTDSIIIGRQIAGGKGVEMNATSFKGAKVGDKASLTLGDRVKPLRIKGIFYTKYFEADRQAFISDRTLEAMQPSYAGVATNVIIKTQKNGDENQVIARLRKAVPEGQFITWKEASGLMKSVTSSFLTINALLTTVGFIIAAVVIFIIIYVDISNKRRQIGIFRAIGIKSYLVGSTYILQSTIYSMVGVAIGSAIFFGAIIPYFKVHPFKIPLGDVSLYVDYVDFIWRAILIIVVSIISGMLPAILATRKPILDEIVGR